jgi:hypothetical protein
MPNCDFYATKEDHEPLLAWLFSEGTCHVYELASDFNQPLKRFDSAAAVLQEFSRVHPTGETWNDVLLQLYVIESGPPFAPRRVELGPVGWRFRYAAEGWGLVQLYLRTPTPEAIESSQTNHNSRVRAETWATTYQELGHQELGDPSAWDFKRIVSFSSRLNRQIRKKAIGKIGGRVILPGAMSVWNAGLPFRGYTPDETVIERL